MCLQEDERKKEERDERKRKYNVKWNDEVCKFRSIPPIPPPPPPPLLGVSSSPGSHPSPLIFSQVTAEDMEAYRMKRSHHEDPMKDFLH